MKKTLIILVLLLQGCGLKRYSNAAEDISLAYLARTDNFWQVWVMSPSGENKTQVTHSNFDKTYLSWFPDGENLLISGNEGSIFKVNIKTKRESVINVPLEGVIDAKISPNGNKIAFSLSVANSRDNNHIWMMDVSGNNLVKMTNIGGLQHEPVWSPDGAWIYFLSGDTSQNHDIWRVSTSTKQVEQITVDQLYHFDVAFSENNKMLYSNNRTGNYEIWVRDKNGKDEQLTNNSAIDARPTWSPDAKEIIFESSRAGVINIWRKALNKPAVQITYHKDGARFPVWWYGNKRRAL